MTTELDVSLRLFEALLILVPVWIAVSKYLIQAGVDSDNADPALSSYYMLISYLFILGAFVMLRGTILENVQSQNIRITIDLLIGFVAVLFSSVYLIFAKRWMEESEFVPDDGEMRILPRDMLGLSVFQMYILSLLISVVMFVIWTRIGSLMLNLSYDFIRFVV